MADQQMRDELPLFLANAEWNKSLKSCLSVVGVKGELAAYLGRHSNQRGWRQLMEYLRQSGASNLANWYDLLEELSTRDIDGLTVGKFVEALGHQNVGLSTASLELKAVIGRSEADARSRNTVDPTGKKRGQSDGHDRRAKVGSKQGAASSENSGEIRASGDKSTTKPDGHEVILEELFAKADQAGEVDNLEWETLSDVILDEEVVDETPISTIAVDLKSGLTSAGLALFAAKKVVDFVNKLLDDEAELMHDAHDDDENPVRLVVFGCWSWLLKETVDAYGWSIKKVYHRPMGRGVKKRALNSDKPTLYRVTAKSDADDNDARPVFYLLQVSPGSDFVHMYAQSLLTLLCHSVDELAPTDDAKTLLAANDALAKMLCRVRTRSFELGVYRVLEQSTPTYLLKTLRLDALADDVKDAVVMIGGVDKMHGTLSQNLAAWPLPSSRKHWLTAGPRAGPGNNKLWSWELRVHKPSGQKLVLFGSKVTYWGNLAGELTAALCEIGAKAVLHVGVKVASRQDKSASKRYRVLAPQSFALVNPAIQQLSIENVLYDKVDHLHRSALHVSVPSPFDEAEEFLDHVVQQLSPNTVDDEGAYIARAAHAAGVQFGALYFVSDTLVRLSDVFLASGSELANAADKQREKELLALTSSVVGRWLGDEKLK